MIETTATVIMIVSERVGLHREEHALLLRSGYSVTEAQYGMDALLKLRDLCPDLIFLDLDMAAGRWLDICRDIRSETSAPILMLSARNTERDKVIALDSGIDDYVVKPFGVQELLARVRAALRRANSTAKPETSLIFESGDLKIDFDRRTVLVRGKRVRLTPKEFAILHLLVTNQGRPIRHQMMLQSIWGPDYGRETQYLRVFIRQLRRKLESNPSQPELICTEPWLGYRFEVPTAEQPATTAIRINATS